MIGKKLIQYSTRGLGALVLTAALTGCGMTPINGPTKRGKDIMVTLTEADSAVADHPEREGAATGWNEYTFGYQYAHNLVERPKITEKINEIKAIADSDPNLLKNPQMYSRIMKQTGKLEAEAANLPARFGDAVIRYETAQDYFKKAVSRTKSSILKIDLLKRIKTCEEILDAIDLSPSQPSNPRSWFDYFNAKEIRLHELLKKYDKTEWQDNIQCLIYKNDLERIRYVKRHHVAWINPIKFNIKGIRHQYANGKHCYFSLIDKALEDHHTSKNNIADLNIMKGDAYYDDAEEIARTKNLKSKDQPLYRYHFDNWMRKSHKHYTNATKSVGTAAHPIAREKLKVWLEMYKRYN